MRGRCTLEMVDCAISGCARRGIYAYGSVRVLLKCCSVTGTLEPLLGSVEFRLGTNVQKQPICATSASASASDPSFRRLPRLTKATQPTTTTSAVGIVMKIIYTCLLQNFYKAAGAIG